MGWEVVGCHGQGGGGVMMPQPSPRLGLCPAKLRCLQAAQ